MDFRVGKAAAKGGYLECVKFLHKNVNECQITTYTCNWAACWGNFGCLKYAYKKCMYYYTYLLN